MPKAWASDDLLLDALSAELARSWEVFSQQEQPPYFAQLAVEDVTKTRLQAVSGASAGVYRSHLRDGDVDIRVGSMELDNTHKIRDQGWMDADFRAGLTLPIEDDSRALQLAIWRALDDSWRAALRRLIKVQNNEQIKVSREDGSADFSVAPVVVDIGDRVSVSVDEEVWVGRLRRLSAIVLEEESVQESSVGLMVEDRVLYVLNTEGTRVRTQRVRVRLSIHLSLVAEDGMNLQVYEAFDAHSLGALPEEAELARAVREAAARLTALGEAPVVDPYVGPAILRGRAAAVFFHEILGHRVEGHRQKDEDEGQTLRDKVGEPIFPDFIDVVDDPSLRTLEGVELNGHYVYDEEGVRGQRVQIVDDGVLEGFLMSRAPIEGFARSNGHGRRQSGHAVVARQGNLQVIAEEASLSLDELREELIREIKAQGKPFGLIFDDISGGFTTTGRSTPNSYAIQPTVVWRVYPDGRPDELVRGVDLIGTPLTTFSRIQAASDTVEVFNGMCGAESGWVPVSASAPDLLVSEIEVQRKNRGQERPPLLPPPSETAP